MLKFVITLSIILGAAAIDDFKVRVVYMFILSNKGYYASHFEHISNSLLTFVIMSQILLLDHERSRATGRLHIFTSLRVHQRRGPS